MLKYPIGSRLRVRQWEDMAAEFGEVGRSHIPTKAPFSNYMRHLCGTPFTVRDIRDGRFYLSEEGTEKIGASEALNNCGHWIITDDMLEPDTTEELSAISDDEVFALISDSR